MKTVYGFEFQRGAATLLTAMALMMATTSMVLAAVHAQLMNNRANGNLHNAVKDYLLAEAGLDYAIDYLNNQFHQIDWLKNRNSKETANPRMPSAWLNQLDIQHRKLKLTLSRSLQEPAFISISSQVSSTNKTKHALDITQTVRPLSILSPEGEQAPPLVIDGCVRAISGNPDLYPEKQSASQQVPAIWSSRKQPCHNLKNLDLHHGIVLSQIFKSGHLWDFLFSVDRTEFTKLVTNELSKNINWQQRRYWLISKPDLQNGRWTKSLGTAQQPVIVLFPSNLGCPAITAGTTIYGMVFYGADCTTASYPIQGDIYGTLAINGSLGVYSEHLNLAHISQASNPEVALKFPILKVPRLLGTWRDF